jgi:hypothetical protein
MAEGRSATTPAADGSPAARTAARLGPGARVALAAYAVTLAVTGVWAAGFPRSFYDDFPGLGRIWVAVDGPFNEHLVRDVGTLNLALATLLAVAALRATPVLVAVAAGASLVNAVPHLTYHMLNLGVYDTTDRVGNAVALGLAVAAPLWVLWLAARMPRGA